MLPPTQQSEFDYHLILATTRKPSTTLDSLGIEYLGYFRALLHSK